MVTAQKWSSDCWELESLIKIHDGFERDFHEFIYRLKKLEEDLMAIMQYAGIGANLKLDYKEYFC
jgi:hypothetical protein